MDLVTGRYKIKSDSTGIPQRMGKAIAFTAEHNILPTVQFRKLNEVNDMVNEMKAGTAAMRMAVVF
jgi:propanol-preferring alcohol dehydrogenase